MSHLTVALDAPSGDKLNHPLTIAMGKNRQDTNFKNTTATLGALIQMLSTFQTGPKDGLCLLQGELIAGNRIAKNVLRNYLMILDVDTGASIDEVGNKIVEAGLFAVIWTTHSFGKDETEIPEEQFLSYLKRTGKPIAQDEAGLLEQLRDYLDEEKRYHKTMLDTLAYGGRRLVEGGMKYLVKHDPMPKLRVMFVLSEPFDFTAGASQRVRIDEWKEAYTRVSSFLDIAVDSACVDPSRLMYTPRVPEGATIGEGAHEILLFDGAFLDLTKIPAAPVNYFTQYAEDERGHQQFATKGLKAFAKTCPDFDIIDFMEAVFPDDKRGQSPDPDKSEWACPNEESHTHQSPTDRGFFVATNGEHWHAQCLHDGCKTASRDDRLWYLDKLCQKAGIEDARELEAWSASAQEAQQEASKHVNSVAQGDHEAAIAALTAASSVAEINAVLKLLGAIKDEITVSAALSDIKRNTKGKVPVTVMKRAVADYRIAHKKALGETSEAAVVEDPREPEPNDPDKANAVWDHWSFDKKFFTFRSLLRRENEKEPRLFKTQNGRLVYVQSTDLGAKMIDATMNIVTWHTIGRVKYKILDRMTGDIIEHRVPKDLIDTMLGDLEAPWPILNRIVNAPIVLENGKQIHKRGYIPDLNLFLDPPEEFLPLPDVITEDDVEDAYSTILDCIRDFPFVDYYPEDADKFIHTDELDVDGHPFPNLDRGRASRAHAFAMIIEPFARHLIDGPLPMYFIDKPAPGSGAGYLADVVFLITQGTRAVAQTMSDSNEEFRKSITAILREGSPIVFVDNVNRKVDSGPLAAAITNGTWQDRILGESTVTKVDITNTWLIAGNNVDFTGENMRRLVPIKLDARVPNPAFDRPKTSFKHNPLQDYILSRRSDLIRAVNILIKNWIDKGKPRSALTFNSFDNWVAVIGGILEAAGITGFLDSLKDFNDVKNVDDDTKNDYAVIMYERFKLDHFTKSDALMALKGPGFGTSIELPIQEEKDDGQTANALRKWMLKNMDGNTFYIDPERTRFVVLNTHRTANDKTGWRFTPVENVHHRKTPEEC